MIEFVTTICKIIAFGQFYFVHCIFILLHVMEVQFACSAYFLDDINDKNVLFESAQRCSSIFIEKPGGGEEVVYAPSGQNATFTCAVNASELLWELNMLNPEIPRHANELEENGIVSGSLKNVGELLCSTLTVLVSDYSHNADICCQGRRASNTLETCCTRLLEYGKLKCRIVCAMFVNGTNREHITHTFSCSAIQKFNVK